MFHRRNGPKRHQFGYPVWMLCVDVDRLPQRFPALLSTGQRRAPLALRPKDYGGAPGIRDAINVRLKEHGFPAADRVFVLTQPRSWGFLFNPVTFYFCYRDDALAFLVAEITNTPWNERHSYVLDARGSSADWSFSFPKSFHVSPFLDINRHYEWRLTLAGERIEIAMRVYSGTIEEFFAGLYLRTGPVTAPALLRGALRFPLQNLHTLGRIYWQALRLYLKGTPVHTHPSKITGARR